MKATRNDCPDPVSDLLDALSMAAILGSVAALFKPGHPGRATKPSPGNGVFC
jgi:hypothetical protein